MKTLPYCRSQVMATHVAQPELQYELSADIRLLTIYVHKLEAHRAQLLRLVRSSIWRSEKRVKKSLLRAVTSMVPGKPTAYGITRFLYFAIRHTNSWMARLPVDSRASRFLLDIRNSFWGETVPQLCHWAPGFHADYAGLSGGIRSLHPYSLY